VSQEAGTDLVAGVGLCSPWWLPSVHSLSSSFAELLPIVSVLWIAWQFSRSMRKS